MTIHLLVYPDKGANGIAKVVLTMPIEADGVMIDGKHERLPKQLSLYLLPSKKDRKLRKLLLEVKDPGTSRRETSTVRPRCHAQSSRAQPQSLNNNLRSAEMPTASTPLRMERMPYDETPSALGLSNSVGTIKIEREYPRSTTKPGAGKVYQQL
jgi:hypothetical protein